MSEATLGSIAVAARDIDSVADWAAAVRASAGLLTDVGAASAEYPEACVTSVHDNGPYIVLSKGLALAHARPEAGGLGLGVTLVRLGSPVEFGHPSNDPVDLVFAFSTPDADAHVAMLRSLAMALVGGMAARLRDAGDAAACEEILGEVTCG